MRPTWDQYFMEIAQVTAKRSTCDKAMVGAVIVQDNQIISTGYNGSVHGEAHCSEVGHLLNDQDRCIRTLHAEENAVLHADRGKLMGATVYVTHEPCENCTKRLNQVGVKRIVYATPKPNRWNIFFKAGMTVEHYDG